MRGFGGLQKKKGFIRKVERRKRPDLPGSISSSDSSRSKKATTTQGKAPIFRGHFICLVHLSFKFGVGDVVTLQFMLRRTEPHANVHFFASSLVIRIIPKDDTFSVSIIASNSRAQVSASPMCGVFISCHGGRTRAESAIGHGVIFNFTSSMDKEA